ncbi:MAG: ABC transporter ATP-binding protein/permease [Oligoflexia bacterium]|nr:ABC transporter ATP-binding protein/permease [Oligoflexia bacterium]
MSITLHDDMKKSKLFNLGFYKKTIDFLGIKVVKLFFLGIAVGIFVYVVEVAFAYSLQAFLKAIGVFEQSIMRLPWWVPESDLILVLLFFFLIGTFRCILQWGQLFLQGNTEEELRYLQRTRLLRWAFHSESVSASRIITLLNDRTNSASAFVQSLQILFIQFTCGLLLGASLLYMEPILTLFIATALLILLFPMKFFDAKIRVSGIGLNAEGAKINQELLTSIKNLLLMQIYGTQSKEEKKAQARSASIRTYHLIYYSFNALKFALPQFIGLFLICLIAYFAKTHLNMSSGKLVSYFYLFVRFLQTISSSAQAISPIIQYWPQLSELAKWWADHSFDGVRNQKTFNDDELKVEFNSAIGFHLERVNFSYPNSNHKLFTDLDLNVSPGECFVVTGPSGVGKSTLVGILLGLLHPSSGSVKVINKDLRFDIQKVRQSFLKSVGYVGAESFLLEGSIYDNLVYGLSDPPSEEFIFSMCKKAECQFVFDYGLKHFITEQGQGLSAGQKQRLSLARALLRKPKVLILDEATANLDIETEAKLVDTLSSLKSEITIIAITHRNELLKIADKTLHL